jgi:hypothetical protein
MKMHKWIIPAALVIGASWAGTQTAGRTQKKIVQPASATPAVEKQNLRVKMPTTKQDSVRWVQGLMREVFAYGGTGRRDPFVSLMVTGEIRPLPIDLRLVAVVFDPEGRGSVAVLRDVTSKAQYSVKMNQPIGRMRVSDIQPRSVTFTLEEYGFSRKETLVLGDSSSKVRTP